MTVSDDQRAAAKAACYEVCKTGAFYDPENGCFGVCASPSECSGWMPFVRHTKADAALASTPPDTTWHERRMMLPEGDTRKKE